jgi:hypothetical protein
VAIFSLSAITDVSATTPFVLDVAHGGTGLAAPGANGNVLTSNGSVWISAPLPADVDFYQTFEANGVAGVPQRAAVNFVAGTGISVAISDVAGVTTLTIVNTSPASADTDFYQQVEANAGGSVVQRPILNFINGSNISVTAVDNPGNNRTDVTVTSTAPEGPDFYQTVVDESNNPVTQRPTIEFGGNGATISTFDDGANNRTVVFLTAYSQVQANGAGEPKRTVLNFLPGFIVADNPGNGSTDVGPAAGSAFGRIFSSGGTIQAISTAGTTYQLALWDTNRPSHVDTADEANGRIIIGHTGTYKIELSIQCSIDIIDQLAFTIRRNGTPFEGGVITIIGSAQGTSNELFMQVHIDGGFVACAGGDFITAAVTPIFNNGAQISYRGSLSTQQIA